MNPTPYSYKQISATGLIYQGYGGVLGRIFVSSATTGTITVYDGIGTSDPVLLAQTSVTAGQSIELNVLVNKGIYIVIGGTVQATVGFRG